MRRVLHSVQVAVLGISLLAIFPGLASAQWGGYGGPGYGRPGGYYGNRGYYGGGYYGNGGHDFQPHWHTTQTPYGTRVWYGNGPHDYVPHQHSRTPWSYEGYSNTGAGPTMSYYPPQPYYYAPW